MRRIVTEQDTAVALDSGDVPVLATPRLVGWMETATVESAAPYLRADETSVGAAVRIEHRRATLVGGTVEVTASVPPGTAGPWLMFRVRAVDGSGQVVATGEIDRKIVNRLEFLTTVRDLAARV